MMKRLGFATVAASALTAAFLGLAVPALATPSGPGNAQDTISDLRAHGYTVIVNHIGDAPLEQVQRCRNTSGADVQPGGHSKGRETTCASRCPTRRSTST